MKKLLAACLAVYFIVPAMKAQDDEIRRPALGISFSLTDFETANLIRTTSINKVLGNKQWADLKDMSPGIGIHYFKGLRKHMDFAVTLNGAFLRYPFPNKTFTKVWQALNIESRTCSR